MQSMNQLPMTFHSFLCLGVLSFICDNAFSQQPAYTQTLRTDPTRISTGWKASKPTSDPAQPTIRTTKYQQFGDMPNLVGGGMSSQNMNQQADALAGTLNDLRPVTPSNVVTPNNYDANYDANVMPQGVPNLGGASLAGFNQSGVNQGNYLAGNPASVTPPPMNNSSFNNNPQMQSYDPRREVSLGGNNSRVLPNQYSSYDAQPPVNMPQQMGVQQRSIPASMANYQAGQNSVLPNGMPTQYPNQNPNQYPNQYPNQNPNQFGPNGTQLRNTPPVTTGLPYVTSGQNFATSPYLGPRNVPFYYTSSQRTVPVSTAQGPVGGAVLPQYAQPNPQANVLPSAQMNGAQMNGAQFNSGQLNGGRPVAGVYPTNYAQQCGPDGAAVGAYVPPTYTPNWNPSLYSSNNSGYRPLISLGQENYNVQLGRGLFGQPTVYVPGQYVRNFLRYIFP